MQMISMKKNYILVHGSFGSPFSNWIPWLRGELEKEKLEVVKEIKEMNKAIKSSKSTSFMVGFFMYFKRK